MVNKILKFKKILKSLLFTTSKQQSFLEDFAGLVEDGVPPKTALEMIADVSEGVELDVVNDLLLTIASGRQFALGMEGWFPLPIIEMIRAGEEGGTFLKSIQAAADAITQRKTIIKALFASITYPLVVIVMGFIVMVIINHSVLIDFATIKPVSTWPRDAQLLMSFSSFIENWWWVLLVFAASLCLLVVKILHELNGDWRQWLDALPLFSLYRKSTAARFMDTLGSLLANGVVLKHALKIMLHNAPPYLAWHLLSMEYRLSGGKDNIAEVLDTGLISNADLKRLKAIASSRGFAHALSRQGRHVNEVCMTRLRLGGRVLGSVLLMVGSLLAALMIFAIYGVGSILGT